MITAREISNTYILSDVKAPWFIDLLNINLNNKDLELARKRIKIYMDTFIKQGRRITANLDF